MTYKLKFLPSALKEWQKLDNQIRLFFKKKLSERLQNPHSISDRLRNFTNHYKIKQRSTGYRLVYEVIEDEITVLVIVVGKREKGNVYKKAKKRIES
ncbi:MAG: type II toxin-antitoxin system RelE/ParE family toxin [Deltaproteobacteria bacterium]|jgi:mRNA interferase RelE/StbE|nr:type II toxin-antitoxin system RelE/ParE family toxin [Deltaproteobacteria bacterium]MBT4268371.1 type II toxin-antitoxin system RelE/ParE family toxin [Deltaproteobacteria bacterium]MBT4638992.1 type II toxin-antitoxin system RelE/ParE family toxin [Deltaproteobacteria bacterium]MBT6499142.1 type II toxin-antitoxin system RelE/ParE family toxin [Deltaproteobacteria bacterium]MBT6611074.1 type II toxin-antitoxin system RelE/ParE family toxin [Deltaproteobacteria bacterium]